MMNGFGTLTLSIEYFEIMKSNITWWFSFGLLAVFFVVVGRISYRFHQQIYHQLAMKKLTHIFASIRLNRECEKKRLILIEKSLYIQMF